MYNVPQSSFAPAWDPAPRVDCMPILTSKIVQSIHRAVQTGRYDIRVMVNGAGQHVVVAGEFHYKKSEEERQAGVALHEAFKAVGIEGMDFQKSWAGRLFSAHYDAQHAAMMSVAKGGSTVGDPLVEQRLIEKVIRRAEAEGLREREAQGTDAEEVIGEILKQELQGHEMILLEKGHPFSLGENLALLYPPLLNKTILFSVLAFWGLGALAYFEPQWRQQIEVLRFKPLLPLGGTFVFLKLHKSLGPYFLNFMKKSSRLRFLADFNEVLVPGRDRTMAKNISKAMMDRPRVEEMLAIVGAAHVHGISQLLMEHYGYQAVSLTVPHCHSSASSQLF